MGRSVYGNISENESQRDGVIPGLLSLIEEKLLMTLFMKAEKLVRVVTKQKKLKAFSRFANR